MEMENVVEKIHRDFSFDLMDAVRETNEASLLQRIKPDFVDERRFADRVEYYRTHYPSYNFVTEKQIEDICLKYGLAFGSLMMFSGRIPVKNRLEISRFKLRDDDQFYRGNDFRSQIYGLATRNNVNTSISNEQFSRHSTIEFHSGYQPADSEKPFMVVPVGEYFTLIQDAEGSSYQIYVEIDVHGSPWTFHFGTVSHRNGGVMFQWRHEGGRAVIGGRGGYSVRTFADVRLRISTEYIERSVELDLTKRISPMIVADPSMFKRHGDAVEKIGHRMRFKRSQVPVRAVFSFVDDPIIFQPVPFGYLVVTKWGAESRIGEIQNPASN